MKNKSCKQKRYSQVTNHLDKTARTKTKDHAYMTPFQTHEYSYLDIHMWDFSKKGQ